MKYWKIDKGFSSIWIVVLVVIIGLGAVGINSITNKKISPAENFTPQEVPKQNPEQNSAENKSEIIQTQKRECNENINVCFEKNELKINITQGYQEQEYYWVGDQFKIVGKGSNGYKLSLPADFPKGIKLSRPESTFDDNTSIPVSVMMQKNVVEPGQYSGKVNLLDKKTALQQSIPLIINYKKWSKEVIHADPAKIVARLEYDRQNGNVKVTPQDFLHSIKLYYFGRHTVQIKSVYEKGSPKGYRAKFLTDNSTEKTIDDVERVVFHYSDCYIQNDGCPEIPDGLYTGYFQFTDKDTKEEILRISYEITITSKKIK